ncbi:hypothetical protein BGZ76_005160, partial [Entomortierella beljakovae]
LFKVSSITSSHHSSPSTNLSPIHSPDPNLTNDISHQLNQLSMTSTLPATFLKTLKAPHFSGLRTEDVEEWIIKAEKYLDLFNIQEDYLKVTSALTLLENHASAWALTFETFDEITWEDFTTAIRERFGNPNQVRHTRQLLHSLKQNGSVSNYNYTFSILKQKVTNMDDEGTIDAYESGFKSQFQDHFAGNPDQHNNLNNMM